MADVWIVIIGCLVAVNCSLIGSFLVVRKSTMMGDAISHAVLPGIVLSYLLTKSLDSLPVIIGATLMGLLAISLISFFNKKALIQIDASIGVTFTFLFALGIILISLFTKKTDLDQECVLYGEIIHVPLRLWILNNGFSLGPVALYTLLAVFVLNISTIIIFYRQLYITSFDENYSATLGIKSVLWHYVVMFLTSLTSVASFESVGAILLIALISVPTASAYLLVKSFKNMLILSSIFGICVAVFGYLLALYINAPVAGCMSSVAAFIFLVIFVFRRGSSRAH